MPFHLLKNKNKYLTNSSALKGAAVGFLLVLCFQNNELWAQNLIINPSFENYIGNGNPCSNPSYRLPNGSSTRRVPLVNFKGWEYAFYATINCKECSYLEGRSRFSIYPHSGFGSNDYLNKNQRIVKDNSAYHGVTAGQLDRNIGLANSLNSGLGLGYIQSHYLGSLNDSVKKGETYYFSIWLSPIYADVVRDIIGQGVKNFHKTNFQLSSFVFDLVDTLVEGHSQPFNLLSMDDATYVNPRKNIIEGNADSNWVELRFTFTANKSAKNFVFGFIVNAYEEDDYYSENPYFLPDTFSSDWDRYRGVSYFVDAFTLLPYPELGDTLYVAEGDSLVLNPNTPNGHLTWYNGDSTATNTVYCPGTYWVRSSSAFSSVTDSVVVLLKPNKGKDSTYCLGQAQLNISKKAYDINWSDGSQGQFIIPKNEGSYYATYKMPGGCNHRQDFKVDFDTLVLPSFSDTAFCDSGSLSFIKTKNHNYRWDNGHSSARKHFQTSGSHQLKVWLNQCIDSIAFDVTVEPTESLEFTDTTLCIGEAFVFEHNLSYPIDYQNGPQDIYTDSTDIILTWQQPVCGEQTDTFKLRYKPCACLPYIPTAFSPNNDDLNDEFRPVLDCEVTFYNLRIYNRWGQVIFSTQEASESWQPQNIPLGQYYYLLSYKDAYTRKEHFLHGSISLIR